MNASKSLLIVAIGSSSLFTACTTQEDAQSEASSDILGTPGVAYKDPSVIWITRQKINVQPPAEISYAIGSFLLQSSNDQSESEVLQLIRSGGIRDFVVGNGSNVPGCYDLEATGFSTSVGADIGPTFTAERVGSPATRLQYGREILGSSGAFYIDTSNLPASALPTGSQWTVRVPAGSQYDTSRINGLTLQMPNYAELTAASRQRLLNIDRTRPLLVQWNVAAFGRTVNIQVNSGETPENWQGFVCVAPNTGSFTIPVSTLSGLPTAGRVVVTSSRSTRIPNAFENRPLDASALAIDSIGDFTTTR